jgi:hypothetical protein
MGSNLSVSVDDRSEKFPGSAPAVHANHSEDLEESEAPEGRGREHLTSGSAEHNNRGHDGDDIWWTDVAIF